MTLGSFVETDVTWPQQLEEKLKRKCKGDFEVMNFGGSEVIHPGVYDHWKVFKNRSLQYGPDMVILQYYHNDWNSPKLRDKTREKWRDEDYELPQKLKELKKERNLTGEVASRILLEIELQKYYDRINRKEEWDRWVEPYLIEIINATKERDIPLVVITWDSVRWQMKKLRPILERYDIPFRDFSQALPLKRPSKYRLPDGHLTGLGYKIVANKTYDIIDSKWNFNQTP